MEHEEMLEKIWGSQTPDKEGDRPAVSYEKSDEAGGWRLYFSIEGTVVSQAIVAEGTLSIGEAIERAYHKLFDIGCWAWNGTYWCCRIDKTACCALQKDGKGSYQFGGVACCRTAFHKDHLPDLIRLIDADPELKGPHQKKETSQ